MPIVSAKNYGLTGVAGPDLGMGDMLQTQLADETEEQRKRRLLMQQQRAALGGGSGLPAPASNALFGGISGRAT